MKLITIDKLCDRCFEGRNDGINQTDSEFAVNYEYESCRALHITRKTNKSFLRHIYTYKLPMQWCDRGRKPRAPIWSYFSPKKMHGFDGVCFFHTLLQLIMNIANAYAHFSYTGHGRGKYCPFSVREYINKLEIYSFDSNPTDSESH